jgi:hypothetical protein
MSRRRKKRNGSPASSRQVDQRAADLFAQVNGYSDARDMRHKHKVEQLKWRTGWRRAFDKWRTKYRPAYRRYTTPVKLRHKDRHLVTLVRYVLLDLIEDYPHFLTLTFWDDLKQRGIDLPISFRLLWWELRRNPSECFA